MKEIVYIQAGSLANYTGTHFWNTQECYFTYGDDEEPLTNHDLSFREGVAPSGEPTFCPRLLIFDYKANFGTLSRYGEIPGQGESCATDTSAVWNGAIMPYRRTPIPRSSYLTSLEEPDERGLLAGHTAPAIQHTKIIDKISYWSDYSHVDFVPRTIQQIPDPPEWESPVTSWKSGQELFSRYNEEHTLMEGAFRLFFEECDNPQGIHVTNDTKNFGSFTNSFLTSFRDEFVKLPCIVFPFWSHPLPRKFDNDVQGTKAIVNDALYLRSLYELSTLTIPIQSPSTWSNSAWGPEIQPNLEKPYEVSAILSAHIETTTLPLRLKGSREDLSSFAGQLNWRGTTPIGHLSGTFPVSSSLDLNYGLYDYTANSLSQTTDLFTRRDITRGLSSANLSAYTKWCSHSSLKETFISRVHAPAYPLPTSFPPFFQSSDPNAPNRVEAVGSPKSTAVFSSISTSPATATLLEGYAQLVEESTKRLSDLEIIGLDIDEMKELGNDLWTMHDVYAANE